MTGFPESVSSRPLWLMTLADLALLLVGFLVLVQATSLDRDALAKGLREGFGITDAPMPVAADSMGGFAAGSATLPADTRALAAWAGAAAVDPRVGFAIVGMTDGSSADVDPATGSAALLAADRARAVAAAIASVAPGRIHIATGTGRDRRVTVNIVFAGEARSEKQP